MNHNNMRISSLVGVKERLMEKLAAASVPPEALENARRMLESAMKDATVAAHALSKDALQRIKTRLLDIVPFLSPSFASKMVDDADREAKSSGQINKVLTEGVSDKVKLEEDHNKTMDLPILHNVPSSKL